MARKDDDEQTPIDPMAVMARLADALESLAKRQESSSDGHLQGIISTLTSALERVSDSQMAGSKLIAEETRRAHRPSNEVVHGRSVFNRRGNLLSDNELGPRKPPLKCIMLVPWLVEWESCTREEVELLNLLQEGDFTLKRIDNTKIRVTIRIEYRVDGHTPSRLLINHDTAFNNDNFRMMVPFPDMLRQYLRQHSPEIAAQSKAVLSDEEEEALIEAGELSVSQ